MLLLNDIGLIQAEEFKYAEFTETTYVKNNKEHGILLGFIAASDNDALVMVDDGPDISRHKTAYQQLYAKLKFVSPRGSRIEALNQFGKLGWEVVSVQENKEPVFSENFPAKTIKYLLKMTVR